MSLSIVQALFVQSFFLGRLEEKQDFAWVN